MKSVNVLCIHKIYINTHTCMSKKNVIIIIYNKIIYEYIYIHYIYIYIHVNIKTNIQNVCVYLYKLFI